MKNEIIRWVRKRWECVMEKAMDMYISKERLPGKLQFIRDLQKGCKSLIDIQIFERLVTKYDHLKKVCSAMKRGKT